MPIDLVFKGFGIGSISSCINRPTESAPELGVPLDQCRQSKSDDRF
jgi:hypothetical protein